MGWYFREDVTRILMGFFNEWHGLAWVIFWALAPLTRCGCNLAGLSVNYMGYDFREDVLVFRGDFSMTGMALLGYSLLFLFFQM